MDCSSKKVIYHSEQEAVEALLQNRGRFSYPQGSGPINVYKCELCGNFHFTSKGEIHDSLMSNDGQSRINREQEANFWINKLRK